MAVTDDTRRHVDTHAHVFVKGLPLANNPRYVPDNEATLERYLSQLDQNGIGRGVLVQPSFLGIDNHYLLDALARAPTRLRGVAVVDPAIEHDELERLKQAGVVGIRLNLIGQALPDLSTAPWPRFLEALAALDLHVEVHRPAVDLERILAPMLSDSDVRIIVDHFGRPDPHAGVDDPGFRWLLSTGETRRVWIKLSGAYRNGADGIGETVALAAMPLLREAFGLDRLVWGSDWPHNQYESTQSFGATRALLDDWLPDPADRQAVLADSASRFFDFERGQA